MKFISLVLPLIIASVPVSSSKAIPTLKDPYFTSDVIGPFATNADTTFSITAHNVSLITDFKISYVYANNNSVYANESYKIGTITTDPDDKSHNYTTFTNLVMPLNGYLSTNGVKITFMLYKVSTLKLSKSVTIYPRKTYKISGNSYSAANSYYEIKNQIFKFQDENTIITSEKYCCSGVQPNTYNHKKNYLVLQDGTITCDVGFPSTNINKNKYLVIDDKDNLFPYMNKSGTKVLLPLTCSVSGNQLTYKLQNTMYVNQYTLEMSATKRAGFVSTSKFYLPLYDAKKLESYSIYLSLAYVGYSLLTITHTLSFVSDYQLFGSCNTSTWCIGGGVS